MIVLHFGALVVSCEDEADAVELLELLGLAGSCPAPERPALPAPPAPVATRPAPPPAPVRAPEPPRAPRPAPAAPRNGHAVAIPHGSPRTPLPVARAIAKTVERQSRQWSEALSRDEPRREDGSPGLSDIDARILEAFRANPTRPVHDVARELFDGHANAVRFLKLKLASLEGRGLIHRVGAGRYEPGPSRQAAPVGTRCGKCGGRGHNSRTCTGGQQTDGLRTLEEEDTEHEDAADLPDDEPELDFAAAD